MFRNFFARQNMKIFFIGTTNAMPMAYAIELKKFNYDVKYIVDVASDNMLSRPEFHYDSIKYPYPNCNGKGETP